MAMVILPPTTDIENPNITHKLRLPPHSSPPPYSTCGKALRTNLNGVWEFALADIRTTKIDEFLPIKVPSSWQTQGFGTPAYRNRSYSFTINPPFVPSNTPVGIYRRAFKLDSICKYTHIGFDGVDCGFEVYINGRFAGMSKGSHMTSEFDISDMVHIGENEIVVRVFVYTDASYMESQDKWRLSGIFRDVYLTHLPKSYLKDILIHAYADGTFSYKLTTNTDCTVYCTLSDGEKVLYKCNKPSGVSVIASKPWTAETPKLYTFTITIDNSVVYKVQVGFRDVEIRDGQFWINGKSIKLKGVNRHDFHPDYGQYVSPEHIERDIIMMKQHNINMIRAAHYPATPYFYELCDRYGMYVMSEADIETHGMQLVRGKYGSISCDPLWEKAYLDRAERMYMRDRNHACIVIWSLGNESGFGHNHEKMSEYLHDLDSRPVHYMHAMNRDCVDIVSKMYPKFEFLKKQGLMRDERPFFMNEFAHSMGNSPGSLKEYWGFVEKYKRLIGGAVWEWCEQSLNTPQGSVYGGDFGEVAHDGNLCVDGIVTADRKIRPALLEYKKIIQPLAFSYENGKLKIKNKYDFINLSHLNFRYEVLSDGIVLHSDTIDVGYKKTVPLPVPTDMQHEYLLNVYASLKDDCMWANAGHVVAYEQFPLTPPLPCNLPHSSKKSTFTKTADGVYTISGEKFSVVYNAYENRFCDYYYNNELVFSNSDMFHIWHAPIDNDRAIPNPYHTTMLYRWREMGLDRIECDVRNHCINLVNGEAVIKAEVVYGAIGLAYLCKAEFLYTISGNGKLDVKVKVMPNEIYSSFNVPRLGISLYVNGAFDKFSWYGNGPHECYRDRSESGTIGIYSGSVDEQFVDYVRPQENGNKTDVRYATLTNDTKTVRAVSTAPFETSVSWYTDEMLELATHTYELEPYHRIIWNIDYKHGGLGSNACGPMPLDEYLVKLDCDMEYGFAVVVEENRRG